jgi:hypothetical protein
VRSTGPKKPEGKAVSSKNALKTGLLSRELILPGESREEFDALLEELDDMYRPHGPVERFLVQRIAGLALLMMAHPSVIEDR